MTVQSPIEAFSIKSCLQRGCNSTLSFIQTILQRAEEDHRRAKLIFFLSLFDLTL